MYVLNLCFSLYHDLTSCLRTMIIKDFVSSRLGKGTNKGTPHSILGREWGNVSYHRSRGCLLGLILSLEQWCSGHDSEPPGAFDAAQTISPCLQKAPWGCWGRGASAARGRRAGPASCHLSSPGPRYCCCSQFWSNIVYRSIYNLINHQSKV